MRAATRQAIVALGLLTCVAPSAASPTPEAPPVASAAAIEAPPVVDGDVLGDPAWQQAAALADFWQTTPDAGAPASERTEVRVVYTRETLYFGVVCYDREPSRIVVNESRRDSPLEETDSFRIVLDTYRDRQNGFVFGTNPTGLEYDGQVTGEGESADALGSSLGGFNLNWDGSWRVKTRVGEFGWSAEFAIPFRTLRYAGGNPQTWGLNLERTIRRRNETAYWAPLSRQYTLFRISSAGALDGLRVPHRRLLQAVPYVLAEGSRNYAASGALESHGDAGGEVKFGATPSLTLDLTMNTDFAQVEADEQQINLDRFNLFYPEKRPFFLENAGFFAVGSPGETELFFSRRIGLGPEGEVIPILAGARLSGKAGRVNLGVLDMQTRGVAGAPAANFAVARAFHELPNRSGVGAVFTNRQATEGETSLDWGRTFGLDGRAGLGPHVDLVAWAAGTRTPGATGSEHAAHVSATWKTPGWEIFGKYTDVGVGFDPQVGFQLRSGYRRPEFLVFRTLRFTSGALLEARPHVAYDGHWKPDGFQESGFLHVDNHLEWRGGWELHTGFNVVREGLLEPFEIYPGIVVPPGTYDNVEGQLVGITNQGAPLSLETRLTAGGFFDGSRVSATSTARGRIGDRFNAYVDWTRNDVSLTAGRFVTDLVRARLSYSFTTRVYVQALVQYNSRESNWSTNLRLGLLQTANTGLFLVYNENRDTERGGIGPRDRSLTLKLSRLLDLLR
ncbi:MAG TPA: DUF5916 domain-containing protein [Vicinamibacteria bacterium]|nr:DUF5916 domain-containing protein [Vicinamibacteria bacterium]